MNTPSRHFTQHELTLIKAIFDLALTNNWFEVSEFRTLIGVDIEEATDVVREWPDVDLSNEVVFLTVSNLLNNIAGYPHGRDKELQYHGVTQVELSNWSKRLKSCPS